MQVDERFFATLLAYTGKAHEVFPHAVLIYEDWNRVTPGGHPHDWDPEEVHTWLLQFAREQHDCRGATPCLPTQTQRHREHMPIHEPMHTSDGDRHAHPGWLGC